MSPHGQGENHVESEGVATSGSHFQLREGRDGVSQRRLPAFAQALFQALYLSRCGEPFECARIRPVADVDARLPNGNLNALPHEPLWFFGATPCLRIGGVMKAAL